MADVAASQTRPSELVIAPAVAWAVKRLWWGALIILINVHVNGWDLSSDIVGMALVAWACIDLLALRPTDPLGQAGLLLAAGTLAAAILYSVPAFRSAFPWAEFVSQTLSQVGVAVVAFFIARLLRSGGRVELGRRWDLTAWWHTAATVCVVAFGAGIVFVGGLDVLDPDQDVMFEWAIGDPLGLTLLTVLLAVGLIASVTWLAAAFATWKQADEPSH